MLSAISLLITSRCRFLTQCVALSYIVIVMSIIIIINFVNIVTIAANWTLNVLKKALEARLVQGRASLTGFY
jgi:hypothetical protein